MFYWLRRKLGLEADHYAYINSTTNLLAHINNLHKRMDRIETFLGPWREDGVGIQTGIDQGRDYNDPNVQNESAAIGDAAIAAIREKFGRHFP